MEELYHYTTTASLLGMLKDCSREKPNLTMWATHCNYLNDSSEFRFGRNICNKVIGEYEEEYDIPKGQRLGAYLHDPLIDDFYEQDFAYNDKINYGYPYLLSLSRAKDSLPMWGMYARQGNGVALVFDEDKICAQYQGHDCLYCSENETILLKERLKDKYRKLNHTQQSARVDFTIDMVRLSAIMQLHEIYREIGSYIKDKAYEFEKEFRIVATSPQVVTYEFGGENHVTHPESMTEDSNNKVLCREREGMIIPYVEQKISAECMKGIIVGPTADFGRMKNALFLLLKNKGIDISKIDIIQSKVPYRG